ncbi:hypothetical protein [Achromobacter denitrificans]|uniref:Uncharacterized protein n=1 Tax=Achromobacter denitrificans TaxID=32002 RepID=A0A6N0JJ75_ACHDE|nr:hypothetical protein [Achromobacter denitrificans]QKQ46788.1 hypothetical protein FOC81_08820 [Achromobacter denitrificans]
MSLEYIAEHWEDPDDAEAGWFETAVEADDVPNCWPVSPSHWQPMPTPPCQTCDDHGAVGNILTAERCPDCSPPAPTSHPIPTGATGEDDIVQRLRDNADLDAAEDGNPAVIRLEREAANEIERLRRALSDAPAAGDALAVKLPAKLPKFEGSGGEYPSSESYQEGYAEGWNDAIDATIAQQQGEA